MNGADGVGPDLEGRRREVQLLAQASPQVIGRHGKPAIRLSVTHLVGKLWHVFPREVLLIFSKLLRMRTMTITKESFAVSLS